MRSLSDMAVGGGLAARKAPARAQRRPAGSRRAPPKATMLSPLKARLAAVSEISIHRLALLATIGLYAVTGAYGAVAGGHIAHLRQTLGDDATAGLRDLGFRVSEVRLTGAHELTVSELFERVGLNDPTMTTLGFNAEAARLKLVEIPWIKSASVRVLFPGTIDVAVVEREPFALWQKGGRINLVDRDGGIIGPYEDERFANLPVVVGEGAEKRLTEIRELLDPHRELRQQVRAAVLVAERRWTLKLADGVDILLPEDGAKEALDLLDRLNEKSSLLKRDIAIVDLRIAERIIVRLTDRAAQIRNESLRPVKGRPAAPAAVAPPSKANARTI